MLQQRSIQSALTLRDKILSKFLFKKLKFSLLEIKLCLRISAYPHIISFLLSVSKNKISEYNKELGNMFADQDISWVGDNTLKKVSIEENFYTVQCSPEFSFKHFDLEYDKTNDLFHQSNNSWLHLIS